MDQSDSSRETRSALIHVRVKPQLREMIEREAQAANIKPSALVRKILAYHYEREL
jgi:hypothetical protein